MQGDTKEATRVSNSQKDLRDNEKETLGQHLLSERRNCICSLQTCLIMASEVQMTNEGELAILISEVEYAIQQVKAEKANGSDGIPREYLKLPTQITIHTNSRKTLFSKFTKVLYDLCIKQYLYLEILYKYH